MRLTKKQQNLATALRENLTDTEILDAVELLLSGMDELDRQQGKTPPATRGFEEGGDLCIALLAVEEMMGEIKDDDGDEDESSDRG